MEGIVSHKQRVILSGTNVKQGTPLSLMCILLLPINIAFHHVIHHVILSVRRSSGVFIFCMAVVMECACWGRNAAVTRVVVVAFVNKHLSSVHPKQE